MIYTQFGNTTKLVSRLGLGSNRFPVDDLRDEEGLRRCAEVVRHASALGVNFFETGFNYDQGKSEQIFGLAFKDMPNPFYVLTKSSLHYDKTADDVLRRVEASLGALGLEKIPFYGMWGIMDKAHYNTVMAKGGPYDGLLRAKEQGLIEHICCSTHANADEILEIINDGCYEGITIAYNVMTAKRYQACIETAHRKNIAILTMNSVGGGTIPTFPNFFESIKMPGDDDVAEASFRFNSSHKEITVCLSGMGRIEEVDKNVKALDNENCLSETRVQKYLVTENPVFDHFCTGCGYCKPCPAGIELNQFMFAYNFNFYPNTLNDFPDEKTRNFPLVLEKLRDFYAAEPNKSGNPCKRCGQCEKKCTQKLPIIKRLAEIYDSLSLTYINNVYEQDGFYDSSQANGWTGKNAYFTVENVTAAHFSLTGYTPEHWPESSVTVSINNTTRTQKTCSGKEYQIELDFSPSPCNTVRVDIAVDKTYVPKDEGWGEDYRELGTHIVSWSLSETEALSVAKAGYCTAPWADAVLRENGDLLLCHRQFPLREENWQVSGLEAAFNSQEAQEFRRKIANGIVVNKICQACLDTGSVRTLRTTLERGCRHAIEAIQKMRPDNPDFSTLDMIYTFFAHTEWNKELRSAFGSYKASLLYLMKNYDHLKGYINKLLNAVKICEAYFNRDLTVDVIGAFRQVSLKMKCNAACIHCPGNFSGWIRREDKMDVKYYSEAFSHSDDMIDFFMNGSEFLFCDNWQDISLMLKKAHLSPAISTNGILLTPGNIRYLIDNECVQQLNISLDGGTKKTIESVRVNVNYDILMKNLKYLFEYAAQKQYQFALIFSFVLMKRNFKEFPQLIRLMCELRKSVSSNTLSPSIGFGCADLDPNNVPGYNEFVMEEHITNVDREELLIMFEQCRIYSEQYGIHIQIFKTYDIHSFIEAGCPIQNPAEHHKRPNKSYEIPQDTVEQSPRLFIDELQELRAENQSLKEELMTIRNSTCWKITAPLRKIKDALKRQA